MFTHHAKSLNVLLDFAFTVCNPLASPIAQARRKVEDVDRSRAACFFGLFVAFLALSACKTGDEAPTPSSISPLGESSLAIAAHIAAPTPVSPLPGSELAQAQPTLVVANASVADDSVLTYAFEVSPDEAFENVVTQTQGVLQDPSGRTSWRVSPPLDNQSYFWRARAQNQRAVAGPYSASSQFTLTNVDVVVSDSLMNGMSSGKVSGGQFVSQGWRVTSKADFIRYVVPTLESGFVEWETLGLNTTNPAPDNVMLFGMWDASPEAGPYRTNAFRVHLRKLDVNAEPPFLRLRWIANGEQHDTGANVEMWDPGRVYRWRLEWGPGPLGNAVQVFLDDVPIILQQYTRDYRPARHWIEFGVEERRESIVGAVYSHVRIGGR